METAVETPKPKGRTKSKIFEYVSPERFAVVRKLPGNKRYYSNFHKLYTEKADAETEAKRLAIALNADCYVIEIQSIAK